MAAETGFLIDDVMYETPSLDTFSMDEAQVLYDYSGLTIEDFVASEDEDDDGAERLKRLKNPGFMRALMHIAYQRGNPKMNPAKVKQTVGSANLISALEHLSAGDEDDAGPPGSTTEPEQPSLKSSVESSGPSGSDSRKSSDGQDVPPGRTTTTESDTRSTPSLQAVSER